MATGRMFKILIYEGGEEPKVEVTVPLKLAKLALSVLPAVKGEIQKQADIDVEALRSMLEDGFQELEAMAPMDLVKINDGDDRVRISIE